jgi:hypothetical protein
MRVATRKDARGIAGGFVIGGLRTIGDQVPEAVGV